MLLVILILHSIAHRRASRFLLHWNHQIQPGSQLPTQEQLCGSLSIDLSIRSSSVRKQKLLDHIHHNSLPLHLQHRPLEDVNESLRLSVRLRMIGWCQYVSDSIHLTVLLEHTGHELRSIV